MGSDDQPTAWEAFYRGRGDPAWAFAQRILETEELVSPDSVKRDQWGHLESFEFKVRDGRTIEVPQYSDWSRQAPMNISFRPSARQPHIGAETELYHLARIYVYDEQMADREISFWCERLDHYVALLKAGEHPEDLRELHVGPEGYLAFEDRLLVPTKRYVKEVYDYLDRETAADRHSYRTESQLEKREKLRDDLFDRVVGRVKDDFRRALRLASKRLGVELQLTNADRACEAAQYLRSAFGEVIEEDDADEIAWRLKLLAEGEDPRDIHDLTADDVRKQLRQARERREDPGDPPEKF